MGHQAGGLNQFGVRLDVPRDESLDIFRRAGGHFNAAFAKLGLLLRIERGLHSAVELVDDRTRCLGRGQWLKLPYTKPSTPATISNIESNLVAFMVNPFSAFWRCGD